MQPRRHFVKLPLQANFYPMPSQAYIQDSNYRLTLHTAQALGVSSLESGQYSCKGAPVYGLIESLSRLCMSNGSICQGRIANKVGLLQVTASSRPFFFCAFQASWT